MSIKEVLRIVIEADSKAAVKAIEDVGKKTEKSLGKSQKGIDKFASGLTKAGVGMLGVGTVAAVGLAKAADAASDLGEVVNKSNVVFGEASGKVEEFAANAAKIGQSKRAALEAASGFGNLFVSMGLAADKSADMSIELTALASDLASFSNTSPEDAITALSSALVGESEPMRRYGVLLDEATLKQQALSMGLIDTTTGTLPPAIRAQAAYAAILEQTTTAQGDFERTSDSAANQQRQLAASFENLKAEIGKGALPVMQALLGAANKVTQGFAGLNSVSGGLAGKIATVGTVGLIAVGGLATLVGQLLKMRQTFRDAAEAASGFKGKLSGLGSTAGLATAAAGIGLLVVEARHLNDEANKIDIDKFSAGLTSISDASHDALLETVKMSAAFGHLESDTADLAAQSVPAAREFVKLAEAIGAPESMIRRLNKIIDEKKQADIGGQKAQSAYTDEVDKATGAMEGQADATADAKDALKEYEDELHALLDPLFGLQDALQDNVDAQGEVQAKQLEAIAAQKAYTDAVAKHGPKSKEATEASLNLMDAQRQLSDANRGAVRSAEDVDFAIAEMRDEIEKNPKALDQAKRKLKEWERQGLITADQAERTAGEFDGLTKSIKKVPGKKTVAVGTSGINKARVELAKVKSDLDRFPTNKQVNLHFSATGLDAIKIAEAKLLSPRAGRAAGGPVTANKIYRVGEQGEEWFMPGVNGTIIPHHNIGKLTAGTQFASAGSGAGGGQVNVNVNILGEGLMRYLRNQVRVEYGGDVQAALGTRR